jgi:transcriptional regulator with XRE-family HTH domain
MDLKNRLLEIITKNNLNASSFADILNIQRSNLSHILSGRNKPSLDFIEKFISKFPDEDLIWLITGNKSIQSQQKLSNQNKESIILVNDQKKSEKNTNTEPDKNCKIIKIITFYEDKTFDIYQPNS